MDKEKDIIDLAIDEAKEQEKAEKQKKKEIENKRAAESLRKELVITLKNALADELKEEQSVKIPLSEYIDLVYRARDLDTIKENLIANFELGYTRETLIENDREVMAQVFKVLYPFEYLNILNNLKLAEGE